MTAVSTTRGYKGRGRFTLRPLGGGKPFELGNVVELSEAIEVERSGRANYQNAAGGELDVEETISSFTFEASADDITPQNIALAFRGTSEEIAAASVSDELQNAWAGHRIAFNSLPDPAEAVTVTLNDGPTFTPLVEDTDYARTPHGIVILSTASAITFTNDDPTEILVSYEKNPQYLIQALVSGGKEYEVIWHGLNAVDGGNPITSRYFRVKFSPTSGFGRHGGDDFATLTLSGTVLADSTRVGAGLSQYVETAMI
jgi:hypothetical protein